MKRALNHGLVDFLVIVVLVATLFPVAWLFLTSLKTAGEVNQVPPTWIPKEPTLSIIKEVWVDERGFSTEWVRYFSNSMVVTLVTTFVVVLLSTLSGYSLSRFKLRFSGAVLSFLMIAQMFEGPALMTPIFLIVSRMGLYNTLTGLTLVYIASYLPFATWLSYSNFFSIPEELEEAAQVDGCTKLGAFWRVTLPLSKIGLSTVGMLTFLLAWSEYPFASVLLESRQNLTVSVGLAKFITTINIYWNQMAAASIIVAIPVLILLFLAQKQLVKGLLAGAIK